MTRVVLGVSYGGKSYCGWQRQQHVTSVQETLETVLSRIADAPIQLHCAGRTDRGVHATAQVVHFDTEAVRPESAWVRGSNSLLPADIAVQWAKHPQADDFHARFAATARRYWYVIYNQATPPGMMAHQVTWWPYPLNVESMQQAAHYLLGEHDFSAFRDAQCQSNSPNREVFYISVRRIGPLVIVDICANAFLHHMVRNIIGVLLPIGQQRKPPQWAQQVLAARDRREAGVTAKAAGLYLVGVDYPKQFQLPQPKFIGPWFCQCVQ